MAVDRVCRVSVGWTYYTAKIKVYLSSLHLACKVIGLDERSRPILLLNDRPNLDIG